MDHSTGSLRLDLEHTWQSSQQAQPLLPPADQICDDQVRGSTGSCLSMYGALHGCHLLILHWSLLSLPVPDWRLWQTSGSLCWGACFLTDSTGVACLGDAGYHAEVSQLRCIPLQDEEAWPSSDLPQDGASNNGSGSHHSGEDLRAYTCTALLPHEACARSPSWGVARTPSCRSTLSRSPYHALRHTCFAAGSRGDEHFAWEHKQRSQQRWMPVGHERMLSLEEGMLVEYDVPSRAPIGAVFLSIGKPAVRKLLLPAM